MNKKLYKKNRDSVKKAESLFPTLQKNVTYKINRVGEDIDISVDKKDFPGLHRSLLKDGFTYYPFARPHHYYFKFYDNKLIWIDVIFGIENQRIKGTLREKILRQIHKLFHNMGLVVAFVGADGSGKSTLSNMIYRDLKKFRGFKAVRIYFGTKKGNRIIDLISKLIKLMYCRLTGKTVITDRYLYLTFRNIPLLHKIWLGMVTLFLKPDIVYVLKKTKKLSKQTKELNTFFDNLDLSNKKTLVTNSNPTKMANDLSNVILKAKYNKLST